MNASAFDKGIFLPPDYVRLHASVRPNAHSLDAFKALLVAGILDTQYSAVDMKKMAATAREIVLEHGHVQEAAPARWRGTKGELAKQLRATATSRPASASTPATAVASAVRPIPTGLLASFTTDCYFPNAMNESAARKYVEHSATKAPLAPLPTVPRPTVAANVNPFSFAPPSGTSTAAVPEAAKAPAGPSPQVAADYAPPAAPTVPHSTAFWSVVSTLCDGATCLKGYQPYCSPLLPIVAELKRFSVRSGCGHSNFEVPPEHLSAVMERKRRVLAVPVQGGYEPAAWPKDAKDLYMYVNGTHYSQRWRRQWSRADPLTSYLPVDITQHIDRRRHVQSVQFTCANFPISVVIVVAYQVSEIDLAEAIAAKFLRPRDLAVAYRRVSNEEDRARRAAADDDDDDVLEASADAMRTICPISRGRLSIPVRGVECEHIQPIDLAPFLRIGHTSCFWSCPKCNAPMRGEHLVVDTHLMRMLRGLAIPRTWQGLELRRRSSVPLDAAPPGSLIASEHYEWVRCSKEMDDAEAVDSSDSDEGSGDATCGLSQRGSGALGSSGGLSKPAPSKPREVISLDD